MTNRRFRSEIAAELNNTVHLEMSERLSISKMLAESGWDVAPLEPAGQEKMETIYLSADHTGEIDVELSIEWQDDKIVVSASTSFRTVTEHLEPYADNDGYLGQILTLTEKVSNQALQRTEVHK